MYTEQDDMAALDYADMWEDPTADSFDPADWYELNRPERDEDNECPECDEGVLAAGPQEPDTGHVPHYCDRCGYEA